MENSIYTVFIVEDSEVYREMLVHALNSGRPGQGVLFSLRDFASGEKCLQYIHLKPDVIILDHFLNGSGSLYNMDGLSVLQRIKKFSPSTEVIVLSSQQNRQVYEDFLKKGASRYLQKQETGPFRVKESLIRMLRDKERKKLRNELLRWITWGTAAAACLSLLFIHLL
ncbi:MAG TPA: response regulator [Bacteroidia bacterium]|jgi:CheY-like chemotaxis protein